MDSSFEGKNLVPSGTTNLTMNEKRELVYSLSKQPETAAETLKAWTRQDILEILCLELGKERKYTGLTKIKIIEQLLKIILSKKNTRELNTTEPQSQENPKRQRKTDHPLEVKVVNHTNDTIYCKNSACRATLMVDSKYCRRCSCCVCYQFDDNKDPSLWLVCGSDACGVSCHLECALKHEHSGIGPGNRDHIDGSFFCVSCRKSNDLLGCWRKQLTVAKETRRVDILCYRVSLSHKLLNGTTKYLNLYEIVEDAVKKLEADVGPLTGSPVKNGRGIVNRLSSGPEVQKLCSLAVELLDKLISDDELIGSSSRALEDSNTNKNPSSNCSSLSNPSSVEDESNNIRTETGKVVTENLSKDSKNKNVIPSAAKEPCLQITGPDNGSDTEVRRKDISDQYLINFQHSPLTPEAMQTDTSGQYVINFQQTDISTPSKVEILKDGPSKKRKNEDRPQNEVQSHDLEQCVKIIRGLESEGHIEKKFRQKFLTWYSLRATPQEVRVVKVYFDSFIDDSAALGEQLMDTFSDIISSSKPSSGMRVKSSSVPAGFCMKLWH